jgi:hypothetical protein
MRESALWADFDEALSALCELNRAHARAAMVAAGFYSHRRQWRRRGDRMTTPSRVTAEDIPEAIRDRVFEFLSRSSRGEVTVQNCVAFFETVQDDLTPVAYCWLVKRLAQMYNGSDVVTATDPRGHAQQTLIRWLQEEWGLPSGGKKTDPATSEILRRYLNAQRFELGGPTAPLVEPVGYPRALEQRCLQLLLPA